MRLPSIVVAVVVVVGCGGGGGTDAGPGTDGAPADLPRTDGSGTCASDADCSDGVFCNGAEICQPGGMHADARGCVPSPVPPCMTGRLCNEVHRACETDCGTHADADGDGHAAAECGGDDCDDGDANRYPGNHEVCDLTSHDEDCDASTFGSRDGDGDGYVDARCCNVGTTGTMTCGSDCDDGNSTIHPTQAEVCNERDDDCNGMVDEGVTVAGFADMDHDLHGDMAHPLSECPGAAGFSLLGDDCDDGDPARHPAQPEICDGVDNDCNGMVDDGTRAVTWYLDMDGDGFGSGTSGTMVSCAVLPGYSLLGTDCDDTRRGVSPGAVESCDGLDDDCNGLADFAIHPGDFEDDDGDGHIDMACPRVGDDCDDFDATTYPGATELCDGKDNNCDGISDGATAMAEWYVDLDGDGYGDPTPPAIMSCTPQVGRVPRNTDCDDSSAAVHPGAPDPCNGHDDNCNGEIDEDSFRVAFYADHDSDGAGAGSPIFACIAPPGDVSLPNDCDDTNAAIGPTHAETCNGIDDNCDGMIDEGVSVTFYPDADHDGVGIMSTDTRTGCTPPPGYAPGTSDCNDHDATRYPGAAERCDLIDNDCNGVVDDEPAVDTSCAALHTSATTCVAGTCMVGTCTGAYQDCDHVPANGCEVDTATSPANCGTCGHTCNPADTCTGGVCDRSPVVALTSSDRATCALRANGGVACWGADTSGQLGDGGGVNKSSPVAAVSLTDVIDIDLGTSNGCAVRRSGQVVCWGDNTFGQLGDGTTVAHSTPASVPGLVDGTKVAIGDNFACAVRRMGGVVCWGNNGRGQIGSGVVGANVLTPTAVMGLPSAAIDIATSESAACAVLDVGTVYCWGYGGYGQHGDGSLTDRSMATTPVVGISDASEIDGTGMNYGTFCIRRSGGGVLCWGENGFGETGGGTTGTSGTPVIVTGVAGAIDVAVGVHPGCAVSGTGAVSCWGSSTYGELGRGTSPGILTAGPLVPALTNAVAVSAGGYMACAALATGGVDCWGYDLEYELGDGTNVERHVAGPVLNLP